MPATDPPTHTEGTTSTTDSPSIQGKLVWSRADTVVWLDIPRYRVMRQIIVRTLRRIALRVELWNGNRERWRNFFTRGPKESVIVYAWSRHAILRQRYLAASVDQIRAHLTFVRIRSRGDARALLDGFDASHQAS